MAPIELPATQRLLAVALNFPENQIVITFTCAGNWLAQQDQQTTEKTKLCKSPCKYHLQWRLKDHVITPINIIFSSPNPINKPARHRVH